MTLVVDHAGMNGEAVFGSARDLSAERPGAARIFGGGVVDALAAASTGTCVDVVGMPDLFKKIYYLFKLRLRENQHNVT